MTAASPNAEAVVTEFLRRQREMYAGGERGPLVELMAEDIVWHVPGKSPIAGTYRGRQAVLDYFTARRSLAGGAISIVKHAEMHDDLVFVQLADGQATLGGTEAHWRTAGVYRVADATVVEAWLVPLDQAAFDEAWSRTRSQPFTFEQRVRPQDCATSQALGHPRFLELFEAAFLEAWRERFGDLAALLGPASRVTLSTLWVDYRSPVVVDDLIRIEVSIDRMTRKAIAVHYDAFVAGRQVAEAAVTYVCVDAPSGRVRDFPPEIHS